MKVMVPLWAVLLIAVGFALWTVLCIIVGAGVVSSNQKAAKRVDPKMN